tara:strand:+ start:1043 stop:1381 length:339 start_codon:yes stop_codon:yes gene_type:complete
MLINIEVDGFVNEFTARKDETFSEEALCLIYDRISIRNPDYVFDLTEICGAYVEEYAEGIAKDYGIDLDGCSDDDAILEAVLEWLRDRTTVVGVINYSVVYCTSFWLSHIEE